MSRIYDTEKMLSLVSRDFREELGEAADLGPVMAYFETPDGRRRLSSVNWRRAAPFWTPAAEQEAMVRFNALIEDENPALAAQISR